VTGPERWITEAELHAHLDGELQAERCAAVGAGLAADPEQAARLRSYRRHKMLIARAYGPLLERPIPARIAELALRPMPQRGDRHTGAGLRRRCAQRAPGIRGRGAAPG
jgi:anti-sigma factor RsiW